MWKFRIIPPSDWIVKKRPRLYIKRQLNDCTFSYNKMNVTCMIFFMILCFNTLL